MISTSIGKGELGFGTLDITSHPSEAKVYLEDEHKGVTPLSLSNLPAGKYKVRLSKSGYKDFLSIAVIEPGKITSFYASMKQVPSPPSAQPPPSSKPSPPVETSPSPSPAQTPQPSLPQRGTISSTSEFIKLVPKFAIALFIIILVVFIIFIVKKPAKKSTNKAIMFVDIEGYTDFTEREGKERAVEMVERLKDILLSIIRKYRGSLLKTLGDGFMFSFFDPSDATFSAIEIQRELFQHNYNKDNRDKIMVKIGINFGEVILKKGDFLGSAVNIASRIITLAKGGEIFITETAYTFAKEKTRIPFEALEPKELKGVPKITIYKVIWGPV